MLNYVKNEKGFSKVGFNAKAIKEACIPYQTIMRKLIVEGLEGLRKAV